MTEIFRYMTHLKRDVLDPKLDTDSERSITPLSLLVTGFYRS